MKGQERQPGLHRREPQDLLEVVSEQQEHADDAEGADARAEIGGAADPVGHHGQRQQRVGDPALHEDEGGEQQDAAGQRADGQPAAPAAGRCLAEPVHDGDQAADGQDAAGHVKPGRAGLPLPADQRDRPARGDDGERDVDVKAPPPRQELGQHPAEQQADGPAPAGDGGEDAQRLAALAGVGEGRGEQRERRRCEQRAERALHHPRRDQNPESRRRAADRRGDR
jgi:hypothetical protein